MAKPEQAEASGKKHLWLAGFLLSASAGVSLLALTALAGWLLDLPLLAGLAAHAVPMAPSTSLLFVAHGVLLALEARAAPGQLATRISRASAGLAAITALALLVLSSLGIRSSIEHLGISITGELNGTPLGHISPVTAGCFLLASLALLLAPRRSAAGPARQRLSLSLVAILLGTSCVFLLAYLYGNPLLYGSGFIPPAFNTSFAFALLALGLLATRSLRDKTPAGFPEQSRTSGWFLLVFILLAAGMITAGHFYHQHHARSHRAEVERQLLAIADLKVSELTQWRQERLGDAAVFFNNTSFAELVQRRLDAPDDSQGLHRLTTWLRQLREAYQYENIFLLDVQGAVVASAPAKAAPFPGCLPAAARSSLLARQVTFFDFHRDGPAQPIHLSVLVPIYAPQRNGQPLGVLALQIDPATQLYQIIQRWPTSSRSAETLLVRREGSQVLFLNELRFHKNAALSLREPLANNHLPAARAVRGEEGIFAGTDYRGMAVLSALRAVPGSPWFLVARMDLAEVDAPLTERLWQLVVLVIALLFGTGAALQLIWRQQSFRFLRDKLEVVEALRASELELRQRNDELTRFTYTVSHDLKSPLVTIQTFVGYLEQDLARQDQAGVEKDFGFIRSAAEKMSRLLAELLELSRVGRVKNPAEDIPLGAIIAEAQALVGGRLAARGVQVEVTGAPVILHGDRVRLVEVFQNLLDNAAKFMGDQPRPLIEMGAERSGEEIVFFVRDNGAGIDPRHANKLFGLFEKLDPKSEGTGIGLALVRRIVEVHGGRIWVESAGLGRGACFRFTLAGSSCAPGEVSS